MCISYISRDFVNMTCLKFRAGDSTPVCINLNFYERKHYKKVSMNHLFTICKGEGIRDKESRAAKLLQWFMTLFGAKLPNVGCAKAQALPNISARNTKQMSQSHSVQREFQTYSFRFRVFKQATARKIIFACHKQTKKKRSTTINLA